MVAVNRLMHNTSILTVTMGVADDSAVCRCCSRRLSEQSFSIAAEVELLDGPEEADESVPSAPAMPLWLSAW